MADWLGAAVQHRILAGDAWSDGDPAEAQYEALLSVSAALCGLLEQAISTAPPDLGNERAVRASAREAARAVREAD